LNCGEWLQSVLDVVAVFADKEFQERVWVRGDCTGTSRISWEETITQLFDDVRIDGFIADYLDKPEFNNQQRVVIKTLRDRLNNYISNVEKVDGFVIPASVLADKEWGLVVEAAGKTLKEFKR
jgi:hypothetical protein